MAPAHFPDFWAIPLPCAHSPGGQSHCLHTLHLDRTPPLLSEISTTSQTGWILLCPVPRAHPAPQCLQAGTVCQAELVLPILLTGGALGSHFPSSQDAKLDLSRQILGSEPDPTLSPFLGISG